MGRDTKSFPICNPYHGEEGAKWTRIFKPDFLSGLGTVTDKFSTARAHHAGRDPGGVQPFPQRFLDPAAVGAGAGALIGCAPVVTQHPGAAHEVRESRAAFDNRSETDPDADTECTARVFRSAATASSGTSSTPSTSYPPRTTSPLSPFNTRRRSGQPSPSYWISSRLKLGLVSLGN
jgi:hypothetical protein